jgi:protein TonB
MQKHRYKTSFIITTVLYIVVGYIVLGVIGAEISSDIKATNKSITISLSSFQAAKEQTPDIIQNDAISEIEQDTPDTIEQKAQKEPKKQVEITDEPQKETSMEPKTEPKVPKLTKAQTKNKIPKPTKRKKYHKSKKHKQAKHKRKVKKQRATKETLASARSDLLSKIRAKINRYKIYPIAAKKRHIQGKVTAHFKVNKNGAISNIKLSGSSIFFNATKKAISKASPIKISNRELLPIDISVTLRYNLR